MLLENTELGVTRYHNNHDIKKWKYQYRVDNTHNNNVWIIQRRWSAVCSFCLWVNLIVFSVVIKCNCSFCKLFFTVMVTDSHYTSIYLYFEVDLFAKKRERTHSKQFSIEIKIMSLLWNSFEHLFCIMFCKNKNNHICIYHSIYTHKVISAIGQIWPSNVSVGL